MRPIEIYNGYSFSRFANVCGEAYINKEDFLALVSDSMSREDFEAWFAEHLSANALETVDGEVYIHLFALSWIWLFADDYIPKEDVETFMYTAKFMGSKSCKNECYVENYMEICIENVNKYLAELRNLMGFSEENSEEHCQIYRKMTENLFEAYLEASVQYYGSRLLMGTHPVQEPVEAEIADMLEQAGHDTLR